MRFEDVRFLEVRHVEAGHAEGIEVGGGSEGVRDAGLRESAVMAPRAGYYASLAELAAALAYGLAKNHPFVDGNKRVALYAMTVFLEVNGYPLVLEHERWRGIIEGVAAGTVTRDELVVAVVEVLGEPVDVEA